MYVVELMADGGSDILRLSCDEQVVSLRSSALKRRDFLKTPAIGILVPGDELKSHQTLRGSNIDLKIRKSIGESFALVNGKKMELSQGAMRLPFPLQRNLSIEINLAG